MLIVRAFWEEATANPGLRVRVSRRLSLTEDEIDIALSRDIEEVVALIRAWLEGFIES
jgi:hypothetical protein